jgi:hypothetical protein
MGTIKLFKKDTLENGTQRFQSQLMVGRDTCDFIMDTDGIMKCYGQSINGYGFYEYKNPYIIVDSISEMKTQIL